MACVISTNVWVFFSGCLILLLTSSASKRRMSFPWRNAGPGFPVMDTLSLPPVAPTTHAALLSCSGQCSLCLLLLVVQMAVLSPVIFFTRTIAFVLSLYAPNTNPQRDDFFEYVSSMADLNLPTVLCGDFNAVFNRTMDWASSDPNDSSRDSSVLLRALFCDCCVTDAWRYCHPSSTAFMWRKPDGSLSSRIDFIGVPLPWAPFVSSCTVVPCAFSDHSLVSLDVPIPDTIQRGPGRWILNKSLLSALSALKSLSSGRLGILRRAALHLCKNGGMWANRRSRALPLPIAPVRRTLLYRLEPCFLTWLYISRVSLIVVMCLVRMPVSPPWPVSQS